MSKSKGPEAGIQKLITDWLSAEHIWWRRMNSGMAVSEYQGRKRVIRYGSPGMADILATFPDGVCCWLEVKSPTGKQTDDQVAFQMDVYCANHQYYLVRSLDDVKKIFGKQ